MTTTEKPGWNYWTIAGLGLVWNLMGCLNYITQANPEVIAEMPEAYQAIINNRPAWATAAFAISVFGGAVGCILLLLRRAVAYHVLILSLAGVAVTMAAAIAAAGLSAQVLMGTGMSLVVAAILIWVARLARTRGWLR